MGQFGDGLLSYGGICVIFSRLSMSNLRDLLERSLPGENAEGLWNNMLVRFRL